MNSLKSKLQAENELTNTYLKDFPHAFFCIQDKKIKLECGQTLLPGQDLYKAAPKGYHPWRPSGIEWTESKFRSMVSQESMSELEHFNLTLNTPGHYCITLQLTLDDGKTYAWYDLRYRVGTAQKGKISTRGLIINAERGANKIQVLEQARNEELEAKSKEAFLNNLNTEIRSPLNIILGFSELLSNTDFEFSPEERMDFCRVIYGNSRMLMTLVNEILDLSRIESGRLEFTMRECTCEDLLETLSLNWVQQIPQGINFRYVEGRKGIRIMADKSRVEQIINEFMQNAVKYTTQGEIILGWSYSLTTRKIEIFVEDTGCGMSEESRKQLLDPSHGMDKMENGMNHLGLAICQIIAKSMNLAISIESQEGRGSKFSLFLKEEEEK